MRRGRPRHDDILTPREWEVLALIEAGLTNEEIASRLGISFGTAKYHVAEIISKLGVESREQAPAAARRVRTPALPLWWPAWLRGRLALPAIGAGIVAATLLLGTLVLTDFLRDPSARAPNGDHTEALADFDLGDVASRDALLNQSPEPLSSYYYRLRVTSEDPLLPAEMRRPDNMEVEVWFEAPNRWRVHYHDTIARDLVSAFITDGETTWIYRAREGDYYSNPFDPAQVYRPHLGVLDSESIADYMKETGDGPSHYWEVRDESEVVQGIESLHLVQVCCDIQRLGEDHYWVDPTHLFLLGMESRSIGTQSVVRYEITELEYNPDLDAALFNFEAPPGVTEVPPP